MAKRSRKRCKCTCCVSTEIDMKLGQQILWLRGCKCQNVGEADRCPCKFCVGMAASFKQSHFYRGLRVSDLYRKA